MEDETVETNEQPNISSPFRRKFKNLDMATCWLNACLQLVLVAFDHKEPYFDISSELGYELIALKVNEEGGSLEPTNVKNIIVTAEDTRIATRISELSAEIDDQIQLQNQIRQVKDTHLNLISGQQCVRDFFICLRENNFSWPDVCSPFTFRLTHSTKCCSCDHINSLETTEIYVDIPVPPENSSLSEYVSNYLCTSYLVEKKCEDACQQYVQAEKSSKISELNEAELIIIILKRGVPTLDGYKIVDSAVSATENLFIRYNLLIK